MEERINEIVRLIDTQLAIVPDNPIEESIQGKNIGKLCTGFKWAFNGSKIIQGGKQ